MIQTISSYKKRCILRKEKKVIRKFEKGIQMSDFFSEDDENNLFTCRRKKCVLKIVSPSLTLNAHTIYVQISKRKDYKFFCEWEISTRKN